MEEPRGSSDRLGVLLGNLAVKRGWITPEKLREALAEQGQDFARGRPPRPVSEILVARGDLTVTQVRELDVQKEDRPSPPRDPVLPPAAAPGTARFLAPGARFGKYEIRRIVGRGGMATVYEALDPELDRRVALKILKRDDEEADGPSLTGEQRFLQEARLSANLPKHPGIVGVYEGSIHQGRRFLAAEFIDGDPLDEWTAKAAPGLRREVELLRNVALAVHHAHEHGVVHRDLKPQNILVDAKEQPHITDFGLAKAIAKERSISLTDDGMTVGTPAYMAPEQAEGRREADRRVDVYALGVMLYEALTGQIPFPGDTGVEIMIKAARDPLPPPSKILKAAQRPPADPALERVCLRALARDPAERTPTASVFAMHLSQWLQEGKAAVTVPVPKNRHALLLGIAAGLALGLALLLSSPPVKSDRPSVGPSSPLTPVVPLPPKPDTPPVPEGMEYAGKNSSGFHEFRQLKDDSLMVLIPAGEFLQGNDRGDGNERPRHRVFLDAFLADKHEVTVGRFRRFVEATKYVTEAEKDGGAFVNRAGGGRERDPSASWRNPLYKQGDEHPVTCVSWKDASEYCRWAGKRLPTESEWEKAARGTDGRTWAWGDESRAEAANLDRARGGTVPVGSLGAGAGPFGLLDACGNVSEICADWMDDKAYERGHERNPRGPEVGTLRVLKGGSWMDSPWNVRLSRRFGRDEGTLPSTANGFRAARDYLR